MPRNVLMVAYHFPPQGGSSGLLRSLKFACYLPRYGWRPSVLSVDPRAYEGLDETRLREVPEDVDVRRVFALDSKRHLAFRSRYSRWTELPDRWVTWCLRGVPEGLRLISDKPIDVIFTTFPVASAVLIGLMLQRLTSRPWVIDLRDPMTEDEFPPDPLVRRVRRWIEARAVRRASKVILTTESTRRLYRDRYPAIPDDRFVVIPNGYDEKDFVELPAPQVSPTRPLRLVHSGVIYPEERDPRAFFDAIARLQREGMLDRREVVIELRGCGFEEPLRRMIQERKIEDLVKIVPSLPYRAALRDASAADALLLLQGASCDGQIPAKVYEYLRLGRPILALTTHEGDTAALLERSGGATIGVLDDVEDIVETLPRFLKLVRSDAHPAARPEVVRDYSRESQARLLADCLDEIGAQGG